MVKTQLASWIQRYAIWIAILFLFAIIFIASSANGTALPLVLICFAIVLIVFRYWDLINAFALSEMPLPYQISLNGLEPGSDQLESRTGIQPITRQRVFATQQLSRHAMMQPQK